MTKEDIKQICQIYDNFRSERDVATIAYNSDDTFWEHILATYNLSQPSLPSDLDEAAEKIAWDIAPMYPDISWDTCFEKIKEGIKAGAEWMAGQEHQVVNLEKEIDLVWAKCNPIDEGMGVEVANIHIEQFDMIARHFYGLRNRALEEAARHVYESWMGGTMVDVRLDMVELGKVLNAKGLAEAYMNVAQWVKQCQKEGSHE